MKILTVALLILFVLALSCSKRTDNLSVVPTVKYNDTIYMPFNECVKTIDNNLQICFDSVVNDSRCPADVECFWAGYAVAKFTLYLTHSTQHATILLNTINTWHNDTTIFGYKITLIELNPYITSSIKHKQNDYVAEIKVDKLFYAD